MLDKITRASAAAPACALLLAVLAAARPAFAASIFMDEAGLSWLTPSVWANNASPSVGNDYFLRADIGATAVRGTMLTSPAGTTGGGSANFTGRSLTISESETLIVKQSGTETLALRNGSGDLKFSGGTIRFDPNQGGSTPVFDINTFTFDQGTHFIEVSNFTPRITFDGVLGGNGRLVILAKRNSSPSGCVVGFSAVNNAALTGTISVNNGIVLDFGSDVSPAARIELNDTARLRVDQIIRLGSGRLADPVNDTVPDGVYLGASLAALGANYVDGGGALIVGAGGALPVFTVTTLADELDSPVGAGTGLSLREALSIATLGKIVFAPALDGGVIRLDATRGALAVRTSVTIDASALPSGLIIDGGSDGDTTAETGETRCLLIDDGNAANLADVTLRGLTIQNGVFSGAEAGGNIHNREGLTLENCRVLGGRALGSSAKGGGVYSASRSRLTIVDCTLSGNRATGSGGGVYFECEATINGNALAFAMSGSTVSGNISGSLGGGLFVATFGTDNGGTATIATSLIDGNTGNGGGGLYSSGMDLRMTATTVANNTANNNGSGGGIAFFGNAIFGSSIKSLVMTACTVVGNTAALDGGGLVHVGPVPESLQRSLFTSCTIAGNRTTGRDGGGFVNGPTGQLQLVNSIVAGNTAASAGPDVKGAFTSAGVNFLGTASGSSGFRNGTDRSFASTGSTLATLLATATPVGGTTPAPLLADNGGPTPTVMLVAGSPANNAGDNTALPSGVTTDQRGEGFPRIREGRVDLGAIETIFPILMVDDELSWLDAAAWSDATTPGELHDYALARVGNGILRTSPAGQTGSGAADFTGGSLTVPAGTTLRVTQADDETASIRAGAGDLILDGGAIAFGTIINAGVSTPVLDMDELRVTATPGARLTFNAVLTATIDGRLTGPGDLRVEGQSGVSQPGRAVRFTAVDETGYTGMITVAGSLTLDFETNLFFRGGAGVTLLGASQLRVDQLLAFREGRLVDPVNGPVPPGVYLPGQLAALGANYLDAGGAIVVSNHLDDTDADGLPDFFEFFIIDANPSDTVDALDDVAGPLDAPTTTDFDGDGLSDAEEFLSGPTIPTDPDSDGDGFTDGEEVAAGTNPNNAGSQPQSAPIVHTHIEPVVTDGVITRMTVTYKNLNPAKTYQFVRSTDLVTFDDVVETRVPSATTDSFTDLNPPRGDRLFYRLVQLD